MLGEVEDQHLARLAGEESERALVAHGGAVSGGELDVAEREAAARDLHPGVAAGAQRELERLAGAGEPGVERRVLVDAYRALAPVARADEAQAPLELRGVEVRLL